MSECPEISLLAAFVESGEAPVDVIQHVSSCDACQEAIESLREEVLSLQIPLSDLWFREHISCPSLELLKEFQAKKCQGAVADYLAFHVEELACSNCQARMEEDSLKKTKEGSAHLQQSRARIGEATSSLLGRIRD
ncbi:MAG TPA: hypothetical protein PKA37_13340 [Planctomycetota bacterium]|nr:hypothetical protein [Planctomycetota bacterium]